jgi:hypothetical protein
MQNILHCSISTLHNASSSISYNTVIETTSTTLRTIFNRSFLVNKLFDVWMMSEKMEGSNVTSGQETRVKQELQLPLAPEPGLYILVFSVERERESSDERSAEKQVAVRVV